jgi:6-phosphogluconolactonase
MTAASETHTGNEVLDFGSRGQVIVVDDGSALAKAGAERFAQVVEDAVAQRGTAYVALSGGSTPKQMGSVLSREPYRSRIPWDKVHVFWGDERHVPIASSESNAGEAMRGFLHLVPIPTANVHPWEVEKEAAVDVAQDYEAELRSVFGQPAGLPRFDLIFLGMGEDGHTASLFPHTRALENTSDLAVTNFVPKLEVDRLTFTAPLINAARRIVFLAGGPGKAETLERVLEGPEIPSELPSQSIRPTDPGSTLTWLVDADAARRLRRPKQ